MAHNQQRPLKPASECIWYVLATIAGEPDKSSSPFGVMVENQRLWNGLMGRRRPAFISVDNIPGQLIELPDLSEEDVSRIRTTLETRGFPDVRIPEIGAEIDFSHVDFPPDFSMAGFVFRERTTFYGARFGTTIHTFAGSVFQDRVTFEGAEFRGPFRCPVLRFESAISFAGATFRQSAAFTDCTFPSHTRFDSARFLGRARFDKCVFVDGASFQGTIFKNYADFKEANFQGPTYFQRAHFLNLVPGFFGATFYEYTDWHEANWPGIPRNLDDGWVQIQHYQRLARLMNQLDKFEDQRMFVRRELHVQRRIERWNIAGGISIWNIAFVMNWLYDFICGYGYGLTRVVVLWLVHMMLGAIVLCGSRIGTLKGEGTLWQGTCESFSEFHIAFALSFGNSHGPLGLNRTFFEDALGDWPRYDVIGPVQTVLGVIILFFLLLTIRNRFRMR